MKTLKSDTHRRHPMKKCVAILLGAISWASFAAAPQSDVESFLAHPEFCAYMASPHDSRNENLEVRFDAAMKAAILSVQKEMPSSTLTEAIFLIKARCDHALSQPDHYHWQAGGAMTPRS